MLKYKPSKHGNRYWVVAHVRPKTLQFVPQCYIIIIKIRKNGALLAAPQKSKQVNPKYQQHLTIVRQWRTK
jgi:hypothetical protein